MSRTIRINSNTREHVALPGTDVLITKVVEAIEDGGKAWLISAGGQKMPVSEIEEGRFILVTLKNGETKKFTQTSKVRAELKNVVPAAKKSVKVDRKANKKAKDRALRAQMKGKQR